MRTLKVKFSYNGILVKGEVLYEYIRVDRKRYRAF